MEILGIHFIVVYSLISLSGNVQVKSGIRFYEIFSARNVTKSFGKNSIYHKRQKRQKRQVLDLNDHFLECCTELFFIRHIRRGNCQFILDNEGEAARNGINDELRETVLGWQDFANDGRRTKHSFIVHHNWDYQSISYQLLWAIDRRYKMWYTEDKNKNKKEADTYWFVDIPKNYLGDLKIIQISEINWGQDMNYTWYLRYNADCKCGYSGITVGFFLDNNDYVVINHFKGLYSVMENQDNCN